MITEKKIVYDNSMSLLDDESSDGSSDDSPVRCVQRKPKKVNTDDADKEFFASLPTCYAFILSSIQGMFQKAIVPLQG
jgi:hypothetical protein